MTLKEKKLRKGERRKEVGPTAEGGKEKFRGKNHSWGLSGPCVSVQEKGQKKEESVD